MIMFLTVNRVMHIRTIRNSVQDTNKKTDFGFLFTYSDFHTKKRKPKTLKTKIARWKKLTS